MSSIITSILDSTVGLLWDKARDTIADKLKDGDVTDGEIRKVVVRDLSDIKDKLDCLARKELDCSYQFLKEGVMKLNIALEKSENEPGVMLNEARQDDGYEAITMPGANAIESGILSEALGLPLAMRKLEIISDEEIKSAKKRFEDARRKATEAFKNKGLDIEGRIFAAKIRVVSEVLECLENPETAIKICLSFLDELHSLPNIRRMFTVYLNRGYKVRSKFKKKERVKNIKSVMMINCFLFQLNFMFSRIVTDRMGTWPYVIDVGADGDDRYFNPIEDWRKISTRKSWGEQLSQQPNRLMLDRKINPSLSIVNSRSEIVTGCDCVIEVTSRKGTTMMVELPDPADRREYKVVVVEHRIVGLAVDNNDNVYVVCLLRTPSVIGDVDNYVLYVFDQNYNLTTEWTLEFLDVSMVFNHVGIAINKSNDIIMINNTDPHVYVCDNTGLLKYKFNLESSCAKRIGITHNNEIMISSDDGKSLYVYTEEGELKSTIEVPESHEVLDVAFHHVISKIIVLTEKGHSYYLLFFSIRGELETSPFFSQRDYDHYDPSPPHVTSHPNGPVAVVRRRCIAFI